jgi:zinc-ribbon family
MIIYGYKTVNTVMGRIQQQCPSCHQVTMQTVVRGRVWATLFWVKVFPVSKKTTMRCNACGNQAKIDNAQADAWFPKAPAGAPQQPAGQ